MKPTPKTLIEAIKNGLTLLPPTQIVEEAIIDSVRLEIKDFLAQKFTATIISNPEMETVLLNLFDLIVVKGKNEK